MLIATKNQAVVDKVSKPYIFEYYNVTPFYKSSASFTRSTLARLHNKVLEGLNDPETLLPKYILMLPDKDLIEQASHAGFGCKGIFKRILFWLASNINRAMEIRIDELRQKRAGSLHHIPKFVWVKMLVRPFISQTHKGFVFAQCHTFNMILSSTVNKFNNMVIIQFDLLDDGDLFDLQGNLAVAGKSQFCRELNCQIRQLDHSSPTAHSNSSAASYDRRATDSDFFPITTILQVPEEDNNSMTQTTQN